MTDQLTFESQEEPPQREDMLYIFNMSEDVLPFIQSLHPQKQALEVAENARLSGREYLGGRASYPGKHVTMLSPFTVDADFVDYVDDLIDGSGSVYVPRVEHRGSVCDELLQDDILYKRITRRNYQVVSYCNSPQLYQLLAAFKASGALMHPCDIPDEKIWNAVEPYGTKTGFRQLTTQLGNPNIIMSTGMIHHVFTDAVADAAARSETAGVVIKTHKGHAGMGVAIFPPHTLSSHELERQRQIETTLHNDNGYWDKFSIIVEDFIATNKAIGGGFPNIEGYVDAQGHVVINYPCGMRIISGNTFAGVELGKDVLDSRIVEQMNEIGTVIGNVYAQAGYVGFFELDFLAGNDGRLYVSESNIRRNGGTFAYQVAKCLFGAEFSVSKYIVTQFIPIENSNLSFGQVFDSTRDMQLEEGKESGVILTSPDALPLGRLGYFIAAENRDQAAAIEAKFLNKVRAL